MSASAGHHFVQVADRDDCAAGVYRKLFRLRYIWLRAGRLEKTLNVFQQLVTLLSSKEQLWRIPGSITEKKNPSIESERAWPNVSENLLAAACKGATFGHQ